MKEVYGEDGPSPDELAQIPLGRLGTPREFGDVVCFLASSRASYVNGVLEISVPKPEQPKPKRIEIAVPGEQPVIDADAS